MRGASLGLWTMSQMIHGRRVSPSRMAAALPPGEAAARPLYADFDAVVFDKDGTLLDFERTCRAPLATQ